MKFLNFCGICAIVFATISCTQSLVPDNHDYEPILENRTILIDDAIENLDIVLSSLPNYTKSGIQSISADDFMVIGAQSLDIKTRSVGINVMPDTLLYAVNFPDGGFSVMAANTNLNSSVLCVTESGQVSIDNFRKGHNLLESTLCDSQYPDEVEILSDIGKDYVFSLILSAAFLDYCDTKTLKDQQPITKESIRERVDPLLETKWCQNKPFNNLKQKPGCAAIALGQILAYNEKPAISSFPSVDVSWEQLRSVCSYVSPEPDDVSNYMQVQISSFIYDLTSSDYLDTEENGEVSVSKVKRAFEKLGYNVTRKLGCENADIQRITEQLIEDKTPIYMRGERKDELNKSVGHAWVIDGVNNNMFHINWGWNGDADGYYVRGIFNTANRSSSDSIVDSGENSYTEDYARDYFHYFRYFLY